MFAGAFAVANLVIWTGLPAWIGIVERRGPRSYTTLDRGARYRRMTTRDAPRLMRKKS